MACDGSENWFPQTQEKGLLSLLSLSVDLPVGRGSVQTEWGGGEASVSSLICASAAEFAAEALEGSAT